MNESLARLHLETRQYALAQEEIEQAVKILQLTDNEALLAEATKGVVANRLARIAMPKEALRRL